MIDPVPPLEKFYSVSRRETENGDEEETILELGMEQYLTTKELSALIKMAPGTLRNLIWKRVLKEGVHYVRPTPRKVLFVWSAVEAWLRGRVCPPGTSDAKSLINI